MAEPLDLLVLGSGVAGLSAAVRAAGLGMRVGVLTKAGLDMAFFTLNGTVSCLLGAAGIADTIAELRRAESRYAGRTGSKAFARLMERIDPEGRPIRSPLEARLNRFLRARGFPPWEQNAKLWVAGEMIEPDVLWRQRRVIVEADGRDPHLAPLTFASDRRRDRRLRVEGWEPVRVTSADLDDRLDELDADLRALLSL